ncbi:GGDEF domain-containing protein, partial [Candidatus Zixiibacteriota bacterium]
ALARILEESIRGVDFAARYGGEEFAVILPECEKLGAILVAQRIREKVEEFANPHQETYNLTVSAGVSTFPEDGQTASDVVNKADQALYRAKKEGRNKVC